MPHIPMPRGIQIGLVFTCLPPKKAHWLTFLQVFTWYCFTRVRIHAQHASQLLTVAIRRGLLAAFAATASVLMAVDRVYAERA